MHTPFILVDVYNHAVSKISNGTRDEAAICTVRPWIKTKACLHYESTDA